MHIIEPHIHMYSRTTDDYQRMYAAGIRACVEPSFWLGQNRRYPETFFDYFELILEFETVRAKRFGIDHFATISLNPKEAEDEKLANRVVNGLHKFLSHPRCIGIGEIGFNNITDNEEKAFKKQLSIAKEMNVPVIIHLPHLDKINGVKRTIKVVESVKMPMNLIVIDHNTEDSMPLARETECWTGMTVYPISKLTPERVSSIIREFGTERMIINGSADWGISDPLSLIKVCEYMKMNGHSEKTVESLLFENPDKFYSQSAKWKPDFHLKPIDPKEFQR